MKFCQNNVLLVINVFNRGHTHLPWEQLGPGDPIAFGKWSVPVFFLRKHIATCDFTGLVQTLCQPLCFHVFMRGSRKFCQRGSQFDNFFLSLREERLSKYHYKRTIIIKIAFHWRTDDVQTLNAGFVAFDFSKDLDQYKKPYICVIFQEGGGVQALCPPLDTPMALSFQPVLIMYKPLMK